MNKHIIEEAPNYYITDDCIVYNSTTGKAIKPVVCGSGYPMVALRNNGVYVQITMHKLVAKYINKFDVTRGVVEHKDDNKLNFSPDNLFMSTQEHNIAKALGRSVTGVSLSTGSSITFESAAAAARFVHCEPSRITAICRGKKGYKTAGGYRWQYTGISQGVQNVSKDGKSH